MIGRRAGVAALAAAVAGAAERSAVAGDSREGERRFPIAAVTESTVTLLAPGEAWLRTGAYGIAVDPRQRDALVGRLRVMRRAGDSSVALVTGQTTRLSTDHVAIFRRPATPLLRRGAFWGGVLTGLAVGAGAVALIVSRVP